MSTPCEACGEKLTARPGRPGECSNPWCPRWRFGPVFDHITTPDVCPATGGDHVPTTDTGPLPRWHHGSTLHCDECGASLQPESDPQ
jgi:hypothetical protein